LSDPNDQSPPSSTPPNSLASVIVTSMSLLGGQLTVGGQPIALGTVISATSIQNGQFQFTPPVNFNSGSLGIRPLFTFQVRDNGGTAFGGADTSANSNTLTFNVTPVNDA